MIFRLLENLLITAVDRWWKKSPKCDICRTVMQREACPRLFLLPVFHDDTYTPSEAYYLKHCQPIADIGAIPIGQRTCRLWRLTWIEARNIYEYIAFVPLLNRADAPKRTFTRPERPDIVKFLYTYSELILI